MLALTAFLNDPLAVFVTGMILLILFFWYFATEVERRKRNVGTVLTLGVLVLCILGMTPLKERLKGDIDIVGGSSFSLRIQPKTGANGQPMPITAEQVNQAISVIRKRLSGPASSSQPQISRLGDDMIVVQMAGVEPETAKEIRVTLEKVAKLELKKVKRADEALARRVLEGTEIVPGYKAYELTQKKEDGVNFTQTLLLAKRTALGGNDIANAVPSPQQTDAVAITLNGEGTDKMIALTKNLTPNVDRIAIVLDGEVINAPSLRTVPLGKNFIVEGLNEPGEVQTLASALMNPLENKLLVEEERTVSPTLGAAVVKQGIWAGVVGLSITAVFVLIYYRAAGLIALMGLLVNGVVLFGVMAMFEFRFSLPGIAGLILIIGMAVDANVLIYERLREEVAAGKSLKGAIDAAYEKAFSAIFDSNITSLITAIILFWLGSSSIKGFAVTLSVGIVASLFSAILVTRVLFRWMMDVDFLKKLSFFNFISATKYDFMGKGKLSTVISISLVLVALASFGVRQEKALGVDFTGGTLIQFQLGDEVKIPLAEVEGVLEKMTGLKKNPSAQEQSSPASGTLLTIRCDNDDTAKITTALREAIDPLGEKDVEGNWAIDESREEVSSFIGGTFMKDSLIALVMGIVAILIYVTLRFEFSFALGGFVAIIHDVLISVGIVVLLGGELSLIHVGAILTIAGYSINDTIVIFDRIRETLLIRQGSVRSIMNEAINATLSRTVLTSSTTILTVAILSLFGGSSLRDFSVTILIGLIVGTYSSIFVAAPIVLWWSNRKGGNLRDDVLASEALVEADASAG